MTFLRTIFLPISILATGAFCATPLLFIGFSNQGAPAIEKNLSRLMEEHLLTMTDVSLIVSDETKRLQSRIDQFTYPAMTSSLAASLKRCARDSSLVVWAMVRECTVKPVRNYFFNAKIRGDITIEICVFNLASKAYSYIGDAKATLSRDKGFIFWFGPVEDAVQISAPERAELIENLQVEGVKACGRVLEILFLYERTKNRVKELPPGITKKEVTIEPSPIEESPYQSESDSTSSPAFEEEDTTTGSSDQGGGGE
jgi:hypothetical protein